MITVKMLESSACKKVNVKLTVSVLYLATHLLMIYICMKEIWMTFTSSKMSYIGEGLRCALMGSGVLCVMMDSGVIRRPLLPADNLDSLLLVSSICIYTTADDVCFVCMNTYVCENIIHTYTYSNCMVLVSMID